MKPDHDQHSQMTQGMGNCGMCTIWVVRSQVSSDIIKHDDYWFSFLSHFSKSFRSTCGSEMVTRLQVIALTQTSSQESEKERERERKKERKIKHHGNAKTDHHSIYSTGGSVMVVGLRIIMLPQISG